MGEFASDEKPKDSWDAVGNGGPMVVEALHPSELDVPMPKELAAWNKAFTGMQAVSGIADIGSGVQDIRDGNYVDGGIQVGQGVTGAGAGVAELVGAKGLSKGLGQAGGVVDGLSAVNNFRKGEVPAGVRDAVSAALGLFFPQQVVASWKMGWGVGTAANAQSARDNLFGGHRNASEAAVDTGIGVQRTLDGAGASSFDSRSAGHGASAVKTVTNTADALMNPMAISPVTRAVGGATSGGERNPYTVSLMDFFSPGSAVTDRARALMAGAPRAQEGPSQTQRIVADLNAMRARIEAENARPANSSPRSVIRQPARSSGVDLGPFDGMYDESK